MLELIETGDELALLVKKHHYILRAVRDRSIDINWHQETRLLTGEVSGLLLIPRAAK